MSSLTVGFIICVYLDRYSNVLVQTSPEPGSFLLRNWNLLPIPIPELDLLSVPIPELEFISTSNSVIVIELELPSLELPSLELNWNCHHWNWIAIIGI